MVELEARVEGKNVIITLDSFDHLLNCYCNSNMGSGPLNADAMDMPKEGLERVMAENEAAVADFYYQCRKLLIGHGEPEEPIDEEQADRLLMLLQKISNSLEKIEAKTPNTGTSPLIIKDSDSPPYSPKDWEIT